MIVQVCSLLCIDYHKILCFKPLIGTDTDQYNGKESSLIKQLPPSTYFKEGPREISQSIPTPTQCNTPSIPTRNDLEEKDAAIAITGSLSVPLYAIPDKLKQKVRSIVTAYVGFASCF